MKDLVIKPESLPKPEFWAATTIYVFSVFFLITPALENEFATIRTWNSYFFEEQNLAFNYYQHYFVPQLIRNTVLYLAFLVLNFTVLPKLTRKEALVQNILFILLTFVVIGVVLGITDTYLKNYLFNSYETEQETYNILFQNSFLYAFWLLLLFGFYAVIKFASLYLLTHSEAIQSRYGLITRDVLTAIVVWMIGMFLLMMGNADGQIIVGAGILIPLAILLYGYSFYSLIPISLRKKKPFKAYMLRIVLMLVISSIPVFLIGLLLTNREEAGLVYSMLNAPFQLLFTAPLSWILYKRQMTGKEEMYVLQRELGQTNANFDFLRSQINPHFLFNALNTIYGTAIQEKAERTCEAVERLGDMMRFMLQENMQDKISLTREIDYLNNYIGLQRLRTDPNPAIRIDTDIEQPPVPIQIAPMLLIPFVENAFKHGISLREPSHIKVTLDVKDNAVYFDVSNSKHLKPDNDPEKYKSGIGLSNVKQRLELLYPEKHELIIRETGKEYFVHLTLQLNG
ncbi:sensor histidine kinase [Rhodocytophaga rosea]|uniref:Sensor histidine kinase n=1 Tax=Rhodocytophaga rosea TaxID=2704465 RepID=A0A6C0GLN1_9BACT|nr:histidine kinase [Rhodocytophaga rosea]QHT68553.1 sensor histidine kinase [Rhodocytophaga rosea]